jgi:transposase
MAKSSTPSFIVELPIKTGSYEESVLRKRFWAAKQQYNALLGEALKRLSAMRCDPRFAEAIALYKQKGKKKEAQPLFKSLSEDHGYREYDLYAYTKQWNTKSSPLSIGARISQQLAKRAFQSVEEYKQGKRGKPRFKGHRGLSSIEDNSLTANLRLLDNTVHYLGLTLPLLYDLTDPVHHHGLSSKVKYIRIIKRVYNGKIRYNAQLICEGKPLLKRQHAIGKGIVGLDLGPQTIAIVCPEKKEASLQVFADELKSNKKKRSFLQRKLSRQLRSNNFQCFESDRWEKKDKHWKRKQGKSKRGKRHVNRSKSLKETSNRLQDLCRREASYRKSAHGKMANEILALGSTIKTEKLSYKSFQKLFGSSVGLRAPGMFVSILKRKAENAGGKVEEINTWKTKLSQTCHCGKQEKKPLSERWHKCPCGTHAQRDLYSAFLACFVEEDKLIADQAVKSWSGMDIALCRAMSNLKHSSGGPRPSSLGLSGAENVLRDVS